MMNPINAIFATHYALAVKLKHKAPMSSGFFGLWLTEVAFIFLIGAIIKHTGTGSFTHSKRILQLMPAFAAFVTWLYFYRAKKGAKAWADYSSLSIGWKRFWACMSIVAIVGPCVVMEVLGGA